jgi:hypothetical protein
MTKDIIASLAAVVLFVLGMLLKLFGVILWGWWIIMLPLAIPVLIFGAYTTILVMLFVERNKWERGE